LTGPSSIKPTPNTSIHYFTLHGYIHTNAAASCLFDRPDNWRSSFPLWAVKKFMFPIDRHTITR
jgi:hypothetical protein